MTVPLIQADAFTDIPYTGNPAAVCVLPEARPATWMQAVAAEMNLPETAFLVAQDDPEGRAFHLEETWREWSSKLALLIPEGDRISI